MPDRIILKLGGSIITDKGSGNAGVVRENVLRDIAKTLKEFSDIPLLLVHGAGSYGHPQARQYNIQSGVSGENRRGVFETHYAVSFLNKQVVSMLRVEGIEAVSVHPFDGMVASGGELSGYTLENLKIMIDLGIVPVLHGDVVMDTMKGACIVSGDQLVRVLAQHLGMKRIGLATDVPGLLDSDGSVVRVRRVKAAPQAGLPALLANPPNLRARQVGHQKLYGVGADVNDRAAEGLHGSLPPGLCGQ